MHSHRDAARPLIAIVGGETLLGKEVRDLIETNHPSANVKLIAADEDDATAIIATGRDEPVLINSLRMADVGAARIVFLAGSRETSRKAYETITSGGSTPIAIDLAGALEDHPAARLRAPLAEPPGDHARDAIHVIAHPAAIALALFITHLRKAGALRQSVAEIFEPASERGAAGIDELQKQTVALLSFKPLPKHVFDAQVSFNMLARYGQDSVLSLEQIELKIERHLASLLVPIPSLRLIQAPVFHGYSISVWAEFENDPGLEAIVKSLASPHIDLRAKDEEPPTNVGVAGQSGITVGAIVPDRNHPGAYWFWLVADNLRIAAENAWEVANAFLK